MRISSSVSIPCGRYDGNGGMALFTRTAATRQQRCVAGLCMHRKNIKLLLRSNIYVKERFLHLPLPLVIVLVVRLFRIFSSRQKTLCKLNSSLVTQCTQKESYMGTQDEHERIYMAVKKLPRVGSA